MTYKYNKKKLKPTKFLYNIDLIAKNPIKQVDNIEYNDLKHSYKNIDNNVYYKSVTSVLNTLKPKFIADHNKTKRTEEDLNMTHEEVLTYWAQTNQYSKDYGTFVHGLIEHYLLGYYKTKQELLDRYCKKLYLEIDKELNKKFVKFFNFVKKLKLNKKEKIDKKGNIIYKLLIEEILYNHEYQLAGQADIVIITDKGIHIHDWKTNIGKNLEEVDYYNPKLLKPFLHLPNTKLMEYTLQLSLYAYFCELKYNLPILSLTIHHLDAECKSYSLDYHKQDVINLLNYIKENGK